MGGDFAPDAVIEGAERARIAYPDLAFSFIGPAQRLEPLIAKHDGLRQACTLLDVTEVVEAESKPSQAVRRGAKTSMGRAVAAVKAGEAAVAVSAGNTGALMALAKVTLRTLEGIARPALASFIPTSHGDSVMLDLGANVECDADNLVQFAIMGAAFARTTLGLDTPSVGLLNVGVEELKGHGTVKTAAEQLKQTHLPMQFAGFVEGDSISRGDCDVIVTDGFTGNIALKTAEGTAKLIARLMSEAFHANWRSKLAYLMMRDSMNALKEYLDPNNHNGAVFLGLNGLVVKSHGGADANGIAAAIGVAADLARADFIRLIREDLARSPAAIAQGAAS